MKRILIIAAHPDDDVLGCGGLISKYNSKNVDFKILFIGEGSSCRFENPSSKKAKLEIEKRNSSALKALQFLKVDDLEFNNLPCGRFDQIPIIGKVISKLVSKSTGYNESGYLVYDKAWRNDTKLELWLSKFIGFSNNIRAIK